MKTKLKINLSDQEVKVLLGKLDKDHDGLVQVNELKDFVKTQDEASK
jgi:Ca2+-binding EF-hand superfamily protein